MANLAIRGHETRGKEVIEILEMLGGKNTHNYGGERDIWYVLTYNTIEMTTYLFEEKGFSLEKFLERYPYKVGDRVRVPEYESEVRIDGMKWDGFEIQYSVFTDETEWYYAGELNEYNEPHKEETEEGVYAYNEINCYHQDFGDKVRIRLGGDFEIKVEDKLTYIVRKKPQYPDTYKECCSVLGMTYDYPDIQMVSIEECNLYSSFIQLIRCRNAYWKIAGKEMGLGKPWKPDYIEESLEQGPPIKYVINYTGTHIGKYMKCTPSYILSFPTEEMRDAFYENFKDLIEACKELL